MVVNIYGNLADAALWKKAHGHDKRAVPEVVTTVVSKHIEPMVERVQHLFNYYKVLHGTELGALDKQKSDAMLDQYAQHKISRIKEMAANAFRYYSQSFVPDPHQLRAKNDLPNIKMPVAFHTRDEYTRNSYHPSVIEEKLLNLPMTMQPLVACVEELFEYVGKTIDQIEYDVDRIYRNPHMTLASIPNSFDLYVVPCVDNSHNLNVENELKVIQDSAVKQIKATATVMRTFIQTQPSADQRSLTRFVYDIESESLRTISQFGRTGAQGFLQSSSLQEIFKSFIDKINEIGSFDIKQITTLFNKQQNVEEQVEHDNWSWIV